MHLVPILLLGFLGSVHCVGMCGGFVFALAQSTSHRRSFITRQSVYYLGKTVTYALLGAMAGYFSQALGTLFSTVQAYLSVALGLVLVVIGLNVMGWIRLPAASFYLKPWKSLSSSMGRLLGKQSGLSTFGLGLLNGLLPCGLVYAALAMAATSGSGLEGALMLAVFGLSTIPALFITAAAGLVMKPAWRHRINTASGVLVIVLGLITIARGLPLGHHTHSAIPVNIEQYDH